MVVSCTRRLFPKQDMLEFGSEGYLRVEDIGEFYVERVSRQEVSC
jgi:hypothetical protein